MAKAKDYFQSDIEIFMNVDEFSSVHNVNGIDMNIMIDNDLLTEKLKTESKNGVYQGDVLFYVKKEDFGEKPVIGEVLKLDFEIYKVTDSQEDEGMYVITIGANMS